MTISEQPLFLDHDIRSLDFRKRHLITDRLSRISPGSLFGRALRLPLLLVPKRSILRVRSGINTGMRWIAGSSIHACWLGHYEHEKQGLVAKLVKPGMKVFDIGANAGFYTLAFSRLVGDNGHVWAFEPFAENASNVLRHLDLNGIGNVTLVQVAVADVPGITGFHVGQSNSMGRVSKENKTYLVPAVTLDALLRNGTLPVPDLVKMDVEGAESSVLEGATMLLNQRMTVFLIALHGDKQMRACLALLGEAGYAAFLLDGQPVAADAEYADEIYAVPVANLSTAPPQAAGNTGE